MNNNLSVTRRLQLKQLEIIKIFQAICKKHNLRHFAIGGTCLGAVRHKGFIPWDYDVDFAMPYEDYLQLADVIKTELPPNYELYGHRHPVRFPEAYALRIHDKNTTLIHKEQVSVRDLGVGIHIDVLIMNGLPSEPEREAVLRKAERYRKLNKLLRLYPASKSKLNSIAKRILIFFTAPLKLFIPYDYFLTKMENMLGNYRFDCSDKIMFAWRRAKSKNKHGWYKRVFFYDDFKEAVERPFEDITVPIPVGYDRYMTMEYGDYMTPPPDREINLSAPANMIVDFDKPYTYYLDEANAK